ncbi:hypothetical protein JCM10212_000283 [Sporobolomyces blumeae]
MPSPRHEPLLVQIPPTTSPLLVPTHSHSHSHSYSSNHPNPDIPNDYDLEFVPTGHYDRSDLDSDDASDVDDDDDDTDPLVLDDDDEDVEDWTLEEGHIEGVPCANMRMNAKQYQSTAFLERLFHLLQHDLAVPGWSHLPSDTPPTLIQVHKVSGSLTNAVFFVSIPETPIEVDSIEPLEYDDHGVDDPVENPLDPAHGGAGATFSPLSPATVFSELEKGRQSASTPTPEAMANLRSETSTPSPEYPSTPSASTMRLPPSTTAFDPRSTLEPATAPPLVPAASHVQTETISFSAPTLLLRIYGPSSGSLISRRNELHILHTLSSQYGIGPRVLGTFSNGRVEEYFHSRALVKEEMRDPKVSRWIGRRMRELHSVELDKMVRPLTSVEDELDKDKEDEDRLRRNKVRAEGRGEPATDATPAGPRPGIEPLAPHAAPSHRSSSVSSSSNTHNSNGNSHPHPTASTSFHSNHSTSSLFSFGTSSSSSCYSYSSSYASSSAASTIGSPSISGTPRSVVVSSPSLLPSRPALESRASDKKRSRRKVGSASSVVSGSSSSSTSRRGTSGQGGGGRRKDKVKLCVWENITRWTREAKLVLNELDALAQVPGFQHLLDKPVSIPTSTSTTTTTTTTDQGKSTEQDKGKEQQQRQQQQQHVPPLASPSRTLDLRATLNLPLFEQQLRLYRAWVHAAERAPAPITSTSTTTTTTTTSQTSSTTSSVHPRYRGRSKRVFAHNDTQYGNLLLLTPDRDGDEEKELVAKIKREGGGQHKRIIVVDFEYAGANPRGFDIANHFCEWQADYHHESLSHSLSAHQPYPTLKEKVRFLEAYVGCDGGVDSNDKDDDVDARDDDDHDDDDVDVDGEEGRGDPRDPVGLDPRVAKLLDEVAIWEPSSHAMWAVWGIVQAKEDLLARIARWKDKAASSRHDQVGKEGQEGQNVRSGSEGSGDGQGGKGNLAQQLEGLRFEQKEQDREGERDLDGELEDVGGEVFDYLSYAAERMEMFRRELMSLGVI